MCPLCANVRQPSLICLFPHTHACTPIAACNPHCQFCCDAAAVAQHPTAPHTTQGTFFSTSHTCKMVAYLLIPLFACSALLLCNTLLFCYNCLPPPSHLLSTKRYVNQARRVWWSLLAPRVCCCVWLPHAAICPARRSATWPATWPFGAVTPIPRELGRIIHLLLTGATDRPTNRQG